VETRKPPLTLPLLITAAVATPENPPGIRTNLQGRAMRTLEVKMQLTPPNLFERFAGVRCAYETKITDGEFEVVGRGPTPEASHKAAHMKWEFVQLAAAAVMYP
jgi:hypothetical protein